jgi:oligoribonuclease NrnB/cAMP/cGMP phosphodiesterase (DHH superfamily)
VNKPVKKAGSTLCLYHDDADGRCGAAIVRKALGKGVVLQPIDYGDPIPWEIVGKVDQVVVTDFSLPKEEMEKILATTSLIWIDHHKSSLERLADLEDVPGLRDIEKAGCVLTWEFFFPDQEIPKAVVYIGDRDIWRHEFPETKLFGEGLFQEDSRPENDQLWEKLLGSDEDFLQELINMGQLFFQARIKSIERRIEKYAFEVEFEGHRTLAVNGQCSGELGEVIRKRGYTIGYCYVDAEQNGELMTFVTLYSDQVDVSKIAGKFGGGGHAGAAGFSFRRRDVPFPEHSQAKPV